MTTNIVRFDGDNGIEIYIDSVTGESCCSVRGYARMAGKSQSTIQSRVERLAKGERIDLVKTAEVETEGGLQGVRLLTEDLICEWLPKDNPKAAAALFKLGVRAGLHKLAGFEVKSTAVEKPMSPAEVLIYQGELLLKMEQRQAALELENQRLQLEQKQLRSEQEQLQETVLEHDAEIGRIFQPDGMLITLAGCLNLHGKHATASQLATVGKAAAKIYREKYNQDPEQIGDARYGMVNAYPRAIAEKVLSEFGYL